MDLRNVVFAIALSFAVLFGWSVIFETPQVQEKNQTQQNDSSDTPSVNLLEKEIIPVSRNDAINSTKRINFENSNVKGIINYAKVFSI